MVAVVRTSTAAASTSEVTSIVITKPAMTANGDLLIAFGSLASGEFAWPSIDWPNTTGGAFVELSEQLHTSSNTLSGSTAYLHAGASEPTTYTILKTSGGSGDEIAAAMLRINGHDGNNPTDASSVGTGTAPDPPNLNASVGLFLVAISADEGVTVTGPSGFTEDESPTDADQVTSWIGHSEASQGPNLNPGQGSITSKPWCAFTINVADGAGDVTITLAGEDTLLQTDNAPTSASGARVDNALDTLLQNDNAPTSASGASIDNALDTLLQTDNTVVVTAVADTIIPMPTPDTLLQTDNSPTTASGVLVSNALDTLLQTDNAPAPIPSIIANALDTLSQTDNAPVLETGVTIAMAVDSLIQTDNVQVLTARALEERAFRFRNDDGNKKAPA